jgi:hypothetical protein
MTARKHSAPAERLATPPGGSHPRGSGRAMVTIGDVECWHGAEHLADLRQACSLIDDPERVSDAVLRRHIGNRHALGGECDQALGRRAVRVGEQHRPGLRIERLDLAYPVVFLVRPGELVLADAVALVGGDRSSSDQPGLDVLAHDQPIGVVAWVRITAKHPAVDQATENSRQTWRTPPEHSDRHPVAGRFRLWIHAERTAACRLRLAAPLRWRVHRRVAQPLLRHRRCAAADRRMVESGKDLGTRDSPAGASFWKQRRIYSGRHGVSANRACRLAGSTTQGCEKLAWTQSVAHNPRHCSDLARQMLRYSAS